jgi:predicted ribosome quality control (RQC) complex YloA/Tae2 family protein
MPFDGIVAHAMARELERMLLGGRIGKIQQPSRETLVMQVRAGGENHRLLLCCGGSDARIHLTADDGAENPATPPMFCMLLRKHLGGGIIRSLSCPAFERILILEIEVEDELGDRSLKKLVIEVMGRHSNIMLLNRDDIILDAARHVDIDISRVREVLPAHPYVLPPAQNKLDPSDPSTPALAASNASKSDKKLAAALLEQVRGFSPVLCREVCVMAKLDADRAASGMTDMECLRLEKALSVLQEHLSAGAFSPCTISDPATGRVLDYHAWTLSSAGRTRAYDLLCKALDAYHGERDKASRLSAKRADLLKTVSLNLDHVQRRLAIQYDTLAEHADFAKLQRYGELITANIYALREGMETAQVSDYYTETNEMTSIPLDPFLSPQKNAQRYFRRYQKARSACRYAESQLEGLTSEAAYLESLSYAVENAQEPAEFQEIRDEMIAQGYLKPPARRLGKGGRAKPAGKTGNPPPAEPLRVVSQDGFEIFIGRNNRQNDRLTLKMARAEDLWFHIKHFSGSHVVVRTGGKPVPESTLNEAAGYAAWFSKARQATKAEVDTTAVRNVRKPAGGKPGMVIYVNYQTITAVPAVPPSAGKE